MNEAKREEAEALVRRLIELVGDDPSRPGLKDTPSRVVRSYEELYSGYGDDCSQYVKLFESDCDQMVVLSDIGFFSTCEHHMLPFYGHCSIAYIPSGKAVLGVSKLARIVNAKARKLQIQERMTKEIAAAIVGATDPKGVLVTVTAVHLCIVARGIKQHHSRMTTSFVEGVLRDNPAARAEALELFKANSNA
jgi:GTP cyclohydrolase I